MEVEQDLTRTTPVQMGLKFSMLIHIGAYLKYCVAEDQKDMSYNIIHVSPDSKLNATSILIFMNIHDVKWRKC